MKIHTKLSLASITVVAIAAIAGCPGGPGSTTPKPSPTATASASPSPTPTPTVARLVFSRFYFKGDGQHTIRVTNMTGTMIDLSTYELHFFPTVGSSISATTSIVTAAGTLITAFADGSSKDVFLRSDSAPSMSQARVDWATGSIVQSSRGELALIKAGATTSANLSDYVRWGDMPSGVSTMYEPLAVSAKLWATNTRLTAPASLPALCSVKTQAATGSANWTDWTTF